MFPRASRSSPRARRRRSTPSPRRDAVDGHVVLVDGVTGSGKTEVYLRAIEASPGGRVAQRACSCPRSRSRPQTVATLPWTLRRYRWRSCIRAWVQGERYDQWDFIRSGAGPRGGGRAQRAFHARSRNVGLVVIDEEHEGSYKQDSAPRYRGARRGVPGWPVAAAPRSSWAAPRRRSRRSIACAKDPRVDITWRLSERANGKPVARGPAWWIWRASSHAGFSLHVLGAPLRVRSREELAAGAQSGAAAQPARVRAVLAVPRLRLRAEVPVTAHTSLTYHERGNLLACHHCGYRQASPCRPCARSAASPYLKKFGAGTQRVEAELRCASGRPCRAWDERAHRPHGCRHHQRARERTSACWSSSRRRERRGAAGHADDREGTRLRRCHARWASSTPTRSCTCPTSAPASARSIARSSRWPAARAARDLPGRVLVQTYEADAAPIRAAAALRPRAVPARRAAQAQDARVSAVRAHGERAGVGRGGGRRAARGARELAGALCRAARAPSAGTAWERAARQPRACSAKLRNTYRWHVVVKCPADADVSGSACCRCSARRKADKCGERRRGRRP